MATSDRTQTVFPATFARLKAMLAPHAPTLVVETDTPTAYTLHTPATPTSPKEEFFCSVQIKKNYVSLYLMPIYCYPDLAADLPERLRKRQQGKSCFNFTALDDATLADLAALTAAAHDRDRRERAP